MLEVLGWVIIICGYGIAIFFIVYTLVFSKTLYGETPFVPIESEVLSEVIKLLDIKKGDRFVDIGSGNGKVVFYMANGTRGIAKYVGIEAERSLIVLSNFVRRFGRNYKNVSFIHGDAFDQDYSKFNKAFLYLTSDPTKRLLNILAEKLPKGSTVVSALFPLDEKFMRDHKVKMVEARYGNNKMNLYKWNK